MSTFTTKRVLILVKTYPSPSQQYVETVCTAGITAAGEWIRLYPIPWRDLDDGQRYKIFSWVDVETEKNPKDTRPESYRVNSDSLRIVQQLDPKRDILARIRALSSIEVQSMEEIIKKQQESKLSLGAFIPKEVFEITAKPIAREWSDAEKTKLGQMSLLVSSNKKPLEKIPYEFRIKFCCNDLTCKGHSIMITEYEFMQAYRNYFQTYATEEKAIVMLKQKYMEYYADMRYQRYLIMGNMHRFQTNFLNIGHYAFLQKNVPGHQQVSIFDLDI
ncbi:MAG: hypothetical protein RR224_12185 [Clostridia bacterium]